MLQVLTEKLRMVYLDLLCKRDIFLRTKCLNFEHITTPHTSQAWFDLSILGEVFRMLYYGDSSTYPRVLTCTTSHTYPSTCLPVVIISPQLWALMREAITTIEKMFNSRTWSGIEPTTSHTKWLQHWETNPGWSKHQPSWSKSLYPRVQTFSFSSTAPTSLVHYCTEITRGTRRPEALYWLQ